MVFVGYLNILFSELEGCVVGVGRVIGFIIFWQVNEVKGQESNPKIGSLLLWSGIETFLT